ncbi:MAG: DNA-binding protein [Bacteroidaceae bacterium]|nr:DNA-binding protein [Bacteroidaceae bacterium]
MSTNKNIGSIPYSVGLRPVTPGDPESDKKACAFVQSREVINNMALARHIKEHGSPFSVGTLRGVIDDVCTCVGEMLLMGNRVQLDGLGTIFVTLSSQSTDDAEEFTAAQITSVNPRMTFEESFYLDLQKADFENVASREAQAAAKRAEKQAKNEAMGVSTSTDDGGTSGGDDGGDGVTE